MRQKDGTMASLATSGINLEQSASLLVVLALYAVPQNEVHSLSVRLISEVGMQACNKATVTGPRGD